MKKITLIALLATATLGTLNSCTGYKSLGSASSVGQLAGNPFVQQIAKSLIKDIANTALQNGITNMTSKIGLNTTLSSVLSNSAAMSSFTNLLSSKYGVASGLVTTAMGSNKLNTVKDVVGLIANNGTNIKF